VTNWHVEPDDAIRKRAHDCPICRGTGRDIDEPMKRCPECGGSGQIKQRVPAPGETEN